MRVSVERRDIKGQLLSGIVSLTEEGLDSWLSVDGMLDIAVELFFGGGGLGGWLRRSMIEGVFSCAGCDRY